MKIKIYVKIIWGENTKEIDKIKMKIKIKIRIEIIKIKMRKIEMK